MNANPVSDQINPEPTAHARRGLAGQQYIVTGAAGPIGRACVSQLKLGGAQVIAVDSSPVPGGADVDVLGDISESAVWQEVRQGITDGRERLGGLINCAAIYGSLGSRKGIDELTEADWDEVLTVNVRAQWQAMTAVRELMSEHFSIVNFGSSVARTGIPGFAHYVASKAAVEGLTRAAAREYGPLGVRVNTIAPGLVENESSRILNDASRFESVMTARALRRPLRSEDIGRIAVWLVSPASSPLTGQCLVVDGGEYFT